MDKPRLIRPLKSLSILTPENWPAWLFYLPLYFYFAWLIVKFRGLMFLYCNPGIRYSGILDDSKFDIYQQLKKSDATLATLYLAQDLSLEEKTLRTEEFMIRHNISFPIVLKPNSGFRGKGVKFVNSFKHAQKYFERAQFDILVQEQCSFEEEAGVFFYKNPQTLETKIFSFVHRDPARVIGDGKSTVRQLTLMNSRYRKIYPKLALDSTIPWNKVLPKGERCLVSNIIKPSFGAQLIDYNNQVPAPIYNWVNENTKELDGIFLGRFDVRFKNLESLWKAQDIKIVELNGAASESNDHKKFQVVWLDKYYTIFKTWHLVFEIGRNNYETRANRLSAIAFFRDLARFIRIKDTFSSVDSV